MSFRDTIILAMFEEMRRDENVFLMEKTSVSLRRLRNCWNARRIWSRTFVTDFWSCYPGAAMIRLRPIVDMTFMDFWSLWTISTKLLKHVTCLVEKVRFQWLSDARWQRVGSCSSALSAQSLFTHPSLKVVAQVHLLTPWKDFSSLLSVITTLLSSLNTSQNLTKKGASWSRSYNPTWGWGNQTKVQM